MIGLMRGERVEAVSSGSIQLADLVKNGARSQPDIDALATHGRRSAAVLLWNYSDNDVPAPASQVRVAVNGIPAGVTRVLLERDRIDDTHSNAYTVWKEMGSPESPTPEQYAKLKAAGQLQTLTSPEWLDVQDGKVMIESDLPRQAVALLRLSW
jgi:xylan 1,4-beta-xylosidase